MADFYSKLLDEAKTQPSETTHDRYGNKVLRNPEPETFKGPRVFGGCDLAGEDELLAALEAAVYETDHVYSVETGEPVEPDHPDSPLRRAGLI